jgi:hypothetical protein
MICDHCKKEVSDGGRKTFGGSVFSGWFSLSRRCGSTALQALNTNNDWDFCSAACLLEFAESFQIKKVSLRTSRDLVDKLYTDHKMNCVDKLLMAFDKPDEQHCLNAENKSTDVYPPCRVDVCPYVFSKLGTRKEDNEKDRA